MIHEDHIFDAESNSILYQSSQFGFDVALCIIVGHLEDLLGPSKSTGLLIKAG